MAVRVLSLGGLFFVCGGGMYDFCALFVRENRCDSLTYSIHGSCVDLA